MCRKWRKWNTKNGENACLKWRNEYTNKIESSMKWRMRRLPGCRKWGTRRPWVVRDELFVIRDLKTERKTLESKPAG